MATSRAEIQDRVEELLAPVTNRQLALRLTWHVWLTGLLLLLILAAAGGPLAARGPGESRAAIREVARTLLLVWPLGLLLLAAGAAWARAAAARAARGFRSSFPPDSEVRRAAFRELLARWHEAPAARALGRREGTAPGRSTRSTEGVPWEENAFATVAALDDAHRRRRRVETAYGVLCGAAVLYPLAFHHTSVWSAFGWGLVAALVGWLVLRTPAKHAWRHRLDGVRGRWTSRFRRPGSPTQPTDAVLARVALALPAAAELLGDPTPSARPAAPVPLAENTDSPSLAARLRGLRACLPLRLPRTTSAATRSARRDARLPEVDDSASYERQRDLDTLVALLGRVQRAHRIVLWSWWLFPLAVWVLAALARQEMSFWRGFLVWALMGLSLAAPSIGNRRRCLEWTRRAFLARFPAGSPAREEAMDQLDDREGGAIRRELLALLRPPRGAADTTGVPVEQAVREALGELGGGPRGVPLPSDSVPAGPPVPAPPARRAPPSPRRAPSPRPLPLSLPDDAPPGRRKP